MWTTLGNCVGCVSVCEVVIAAVAGFIGVVILVLWFSVEAYRDSYPYKVEEIAEEIRNGSNTTDPVDRWIAENLFHQQITRRMLVIVILMTLVTIYVLLTVALRIWVAEMSRKGLRKWLLGKGALSAALLPVEVIIFINTALVKQVIVASWVLYSAWALLVVAGFRAQVMQMPDEDAESRSKVKEDERGRQRALPSPLRFAVSGEERGSSYFMFDV